VLKAKPEKEKKNMKVRTRRGYNVTGLRLAKSSGMRYFAQQKVVPFLLYNQ